MLMKIQWQYLQMVAVQENQGQQGDVGAVIFKNGIVINKPAIKPAK